MVPDASVLTSTRGSPAAPPTPASDSAAAAAPSLNSAARPDPASDPASSPASASPAAGIVLGCSAAKALNRLPSSQPRRAWDAYDYSRDMYGHSRGA